jgi:nucleotide-binding universal stress UspA family protein
MRIILGAEANARTDGAIRLAKVLADEAGAVIEVVHVLEPLPVYGPGAVGTLSFGSDQEAEERSRFFGAKVREAIMEVEPGAIDWPLQVVAGPAPVAIVHAAQSGAASLILLGRGEHGLLHRWFGTETALRVAQLSNIPVMAVPENQEGQRPRTVVGAVDFSSFSLDAVRAAIMVCAPGATLHLAHVVQPLRADFAFQGDFDTADERRARARQALIDWAGSLDRPDSMMIECHVLEGDVPQEVLRLADRVEADLVVSGSHGLGFFGRVVFGSSSSALLRGARCSILVAPPAEPEAQMRGLVTGAEPGRLELPRIVRPEAGHEH